MLDLTPIKTRLASATPGPWSAYSAMCCPDMGGVSGPKGSVCTAQVGRYGHPMTLEDAEFVAAARADVEALVAEVERLRQQVLASHEGAARENARLRLHLTGAKPMTFVAAPGEFENEEDGA